MAKLTLADVTNIGGNPTSAANVINNNNDLVEQALENTLSRNGSTPNQMLVDLDMNGNDLINVGNVDADDITIDGTSLATQVDAAAQSAQDASNSAIAAQGSASDALISASAALDAQIAAEAAEDNITLLIPTINSALQPEDIGTTVQAQDTLLQNIAGLTTADGGFIRTTGVDTVVAQAIVGTVSQSGGIPTGAIVERGSNANGEYVRFADGTLICIHSVSSTDVTTAIGSMFWSASDIVWTFPSVFIGAPRVSHTGVNSTRPVGLSQTSSTSTTTFTFRFWSATSLTGSPAAHVTAIGRWF